MRSAPAEPRHQILLFQAEAVAGNWDKAEARLQTLRSLSPDADGLSRIFLPVLAAERVRQSVFRGEAEPTIFGEPEQWMGFLAQALRLSLAGEHGAASDLRERAFAEAPASAGQCNGEAFDWIADGDSRLGPMLEVILDGRYFWVPWSRIQSVQVAKPVDLRNLVWAPAEFTWANQGQATGFIPARYPGTESSGSGQLIFARRTEWIEDTSGICIGSGQRQLIFSEGECALLEIRDLSIAAAHQPAEPAMPELPSEEIFLPCLLDRLTDDEPENPRERRHHLSVTMQQLRRAVLRDLRWLSTRPRPAKRWASRIIPKFRRQC